MRKSYRDMEKFRETKRAQKKRYYAKTQNAKNKYKRWKPSELQLVIEHKITDTQLSELLGRSVASIQIARGNYKKKMEKEDSTDIK